MSELNNLEIRELARNKGVRMWQIADYLQVSEMWVSRKLRHELDSKDREEFIRIINELSEGK